MDWENERSKYRINLEPSEIWELKALSHILNGLSKLSIKVFE